jgi:AraC family transcriptional regulator, regulatory protein of adaptative response / DNA-3-methyladenine glycosylase II
MAMFALDPEIAHRITASIDTRYDARFVVGSVTTGVYCRPSCSTTSPRRENTRFFASGTEARETGLRPCKRCRPDIPAGAKMSDRRGDVARRALRLIEDGLVDREGVRGLARRLGYSERQLHRVLTAELGASAIALARAQRAHAARVLIDSSSLTLTQIAHAAGFGSVRQFNDTMRETFGMPPSQLRARARRAAPLPANLLRLELPCREPFDGAALVRFLRRHEVPRLEHVRGSSYTRALSLEHGDGVVTLTPQPASVVCELRLDDLRDLTAAIARCRRLFDLEADPATIHAQLRSDATIGSLVDRNPGVRIPGTVDGFELAVRTIIRENTTPENARRTTSALVQHFGRPLEAPSGEVTHTFPGAHVLAEADPDSFAVDAESARTIQALARQVSEGAIGLDAGADLEDAIVTLLAIPGIGPWIASYIAMRALGDPDAFLFGCARVERALARFGVDTAHANAAALADGWRPWRSYAIAQLWRSLDDEDEAIEARSGRDA